MRVLFLHQTFPSANEEGSGRPYDFAKQLVDDGHQVTIIAGGFSYLHGGKVAEGAKGLFLRREKHPAGFTVLRPWSYRGYHGSYFTRLITFISYMFTSLITALFAGKFDVVVGATPPISVAIIAWLAAGLKRSLFVFEVRDLWSEVAIHLGIIKNRILIQLVRLVEKTLYRSAKKIIINSPGFRHPLESLGIPADKIELVPNGVDLEVFRPGLDGGGIRRQYGLEGKTVGVYTGSLGMANDIDTILKAAEMGRDQGLAFMLVGEGKDGGRLRGLCRQKNLDNVIFTGPQKKQRVPLFLAASDVGVVTLLDIPLFKTVYPNKVFDTMACGRPLLLLVDGVAREVVEKAGAGIFVPPSDAEKLVQAMVWLRENKQEAVAMGNRGRLFVEKNFDRWECALHMERCLLCVCKQCAPGSRN